MKRSERGMGLFQFAGTFLTFTALQDFFSGTSPLQFVLKVGGGGGVEIRGGDILLPQSRGA